ncbi:nuclear transport factor 2 family protein [Arthrobacter sp. NPDC056493]|uniref:nuclear transport factor 2 family protein n=1 Tax=Arthrobacter sp. NPDC056493 TaxID=3345839 RepID=UPI003672DA76
MPPTLKFDDLLAISDLKARYFLYVDSKRWDLVPGLFTDNARFTGYAFNVAGTTKEFVAALSAFLDSARSHHSATMPRFQPIAADVVRAVWTMNDYVTWEPDSRIYKNVRVPGMYGIRGYGLYQDEYLRTPAGWRISFSGLVRTRIDPLVGTPALDCYEFPTPDETWLNAGNPVRA